MLPVDGSLLIPQICVLGGSIRYSICQGSAGPCLQAFLHTPEGFPTVESAPKDKVMGVEGFRRGLDVRDKLLWCNRALRFIVSILSKLVGDHEIEVNVAAKAT